MLASMTDTFIDTVFLLCIRGVTLHHSAGPYVIGLNVFTLQCTVVLCSLQGHQCK